MNETSRYRPTHRIRVVTAASLFDGHDAAINIMRRILQSTGCEVIHLGHNRAALDVATAAIHEDAQAVAISSYQGGHMEYFRYLRKLLDERGASHVRIFGGGGGVIVPEEIATLQDEGTVDRIYSPEDGRRHGLQGLINDLVQRSDYDPATLESPDLTALDAGDPAAIARAITLSERALDVPGSMPDSLRTHLDQAATRTTPVVGITGTGGAGKSSLTDELLRRWLFDRPTDRVAILSVDPTRKRTGGALLGDRIRMNAIDPARVFMRSLATRDRKGELSGAIRDAVLVAKAAGFDVIFVETSGIGQGDADIVPIADVSIYVMTPEYGAPTQLEKIEMLDHADLIAVNKFGRRGAMDALRDVRKQVRRNRDLWTAADDDLPVYGTSASRFHDDGATALYQGLLGAIGRKIPGFPASSRLPRVDRKHGDDAAPIVAADRQRYLADIADTVRRYHARTRSQVDAARRHQRLADTLVEVRGTTAEPEIAQRVEQSDATLDADTRRDLAAWPATVDAWSRDELVYKVRGQEVHQPIVRHSLTGSRIPRVSLPTQTQDHGEILRFLRKENVPGSFPYTGGVFPLKRQGEDPKRMFAGEGGPARTNRRFHLLCEGETAHRLSTAFDSVTLYGEDPAIRPDIFGKIGESGVSVPHLDDMKILYGGFDLCAPSTSVSMTINGPAPILLAMYLNTAIDDRIRRWTDDNGRAPDDAQRATLAQEAIHVVRGTVQADILKEDQAQNTCIFSTEFALKMMGDIQAWFVDNDVRNFYSVSISGYHIAEAGANPVTQLAFTLSNGFTIVEYYLARGMAIDDFAPNLSFFFSNGLDPEYTVIGRVARRLWAIAMRDRYGASARSQMLKYHIQTSGRSLHAREVQFNDIRTTLQALLAITDNCNSLHTNAYDEAITTPTDESVRRAMAIQLIINREFGAAFNENNLQGSYFVEQLTDLVEDAVLAEFDQIDRRGGVLGAMELQYQRSKIQDESMLYEHKKHDGSLPIVGINTFLDPTKAEDWVPQTPELRRASTAEKQAQIDSVSAFQHAHAADAPAALARLQQTALANGNIFGELMHTVRVATLGQITAALYEVGGAYRRNL